MSKERKRRRALHPLEGEDTCLSFHKSSQVDLTSQRFVAVQSGGCRPTCRFTSRMGRCFNRAPVRRLAIPCTRPVRYGHMYSLSLSRPAASFTQPHTTACALRAQSWANTWCAAALRRSSESCPSDPMLAAASPRAYAQCCADSSSRSLLGFSDALSICADDAACGGRRRHETS
jgi:hypothetical protein